MLINLHTHRQTKEGEKSIRSLYENFGEAAEPGYYSIGVHPCHISKPWLAQFKEIKDHSRLSNVVAIGETGLDKICSTEWPLQQLSFTAHIQWAVFLQKPLIIHCVKAWDEIFAALTKEKVSVPVIFHGYAKNLQLAQQITRQGYYLSFGKALAQERLQQVLSAIPVNQFFLETDDADIEIETVYDYAAAALSIDRISLSLQLQKNAEAVFGPSFIV
ncbi:MAG: TatD family hydrolase [Chitinophagaceae bacterium]|nr:TatD family hydrolase [Chitinophagaceae bacterium]